MDKYRIVCVAIVQGDLPGPQFPYQGLRITPNVYTTVQEIDTFVEAMQDVLAHGLPKPA
jgi:selenocysteine lyase/cysteine desulfurase